MREHISLALRGLRDTRALTAVAIVSLAFALALNVLIFSFTYPVLFKALPYPEPDRLMDISMAPPGKPESRGPLTPPLYVLLRDRTSAAFEAVGVFDAGRSANLAGDAQGPAERMDGHRITAGGLAALGARPLFGRLPIAAEEQPGANATMVLGYRLWQERFGRRADIVNQTVQVDGQPTQTLAVMPEGFGLLDTSSDAWFTFGFEPTSPAQETQHSLRGVGRLKPGVSIGQAEAAVKLALDEYAGTFPDRDRGWTVELTPWRDARFGALRQPLTMIQLAVGGMLVLLCVNLTALLLVRGASHGPAVPLAVGRRSPSVAITESLTLSLSGGIIGVVLAAVALPALRVLTPRLLPRLDEVSLDINVVGFSAVLCVFTGFLVGVVPAWQALRRGTTKPSTRSNSRAWFGATLLVTVVAVQVALAFLLLSGAGLALRAFAGLRGKDVGINPSGLLSLDVHLPRAPYVTPNVDQVGSIEIAEYASTGPALYDRIRTALQTMPGAVDAAGVGTPPFTAAPFVQFWIEEQEHTPDHQLAGQYLAVTENYFKTMGIRIVRGRDFSPADQADSPWVVLVNEALARQQWPNVDPIGQRLTLTFRPNDEEPARQIVGLVADTLPFRGASEVPPLIYVLHRQQEARQRASFEARRTVMSFVVRTTGDPVALGAAARELVGKIDATTPVAQIRTVESYANAAQVMLLQFVATLLSIFAFVALATCAAGLCGLMSLGVAQHRRVLTLTLLATAAVIIGAAAGGYAWLRVGQSIAPLIENLAVTPSDPVTIAFASGVLLATAVVACLVPVLRTGRMGR